MLLTKAKVNSLEVLISNTLIKSYTSHDKFFSVNNVIRECDYMEKAITNLKTSVIHRRF